jgi:hypothetical protein
VTPEQQILQLSTVTQQRLERLNAVLLETHRVSSSVRLTFSRSAALAADHGNAPMRKAAAMAAKQHDWRASTL